MRALQDADEARECEAFSKENGASRIAMLQFLISGFLGCSFNKSLHLRTGLAQNSRWPCPPQTAESLRFAAVLDELPIKIGRRSVLLLKEKEAKAESEVPIPPNVPMVCANGLIEPRPGSQAQLGLTQAWALSKGL